MNSKPLTIFMAVVAAMAFGQQKPAYTDAEAAQHIGEDATVTGKVFSVSTTGSGTTFINLGAAFPKHTFGAIVFSSKQAAVGDVKQYEGKDVAITGRIEQSTRDQKPQIILNSADQIKLAGAPVPATTAAPTPAPQPAPATPAPTVPMTTGPAAATSPAPPAAPPPESPVIEPTSGRHSGTVSLATNWTSTRRGGDSIRMDLARLLGSCGSASELKTVDTSIDVYPNIPFLTPVSIARKTLNLDGAPSNKTRVATPGFPIDSFNAHVFSGVFPGGFSRLYMITDNDDQVVSVLLVDSSSRTRVQNETDTSGYHTYNFVTGGAKATSGLVIRHEVTPSKTPSGVVVVDTLLIDPNDPDGSATGKSSKGIMSKSGSATKQKTGRVLERARWFIPTPIVNLILRCVTGS